jgi:hypothetical protein
MSFDLPQRWDSHWQIQVDKCAPDSFGRTEVVASILGISLPPFTLPRNVDVVGFDVLRNDIEAIVIAIVEDALKLGA